VSCRVARLVFLVLSDLCVVLVSASLGEEMSSSEAPCCDPRIGGGGSGTPMMQCGCAAYPCHYQSPNNYIPTSESSMYTYGIKEITSLILTDPWVVQNIQQRPDRSNP
jgi:hypothetical protein